MRKHVISVNGNKRFKRILVEGEKFKSRGLPSKDFIFQFVFFTTAACPVLKHNQVSKVLKGFKVHDLEYYSQINYVLKWKFTAVFSNMRPSRNFSQWPNVCLVDVNHLFL